MDIRKVSTSVSLTNNRRINFEFGRLVAHDVLSAPFSYELEVSGTAGMDIGRMLGMQLAVRVGLQGPIGRYFHGQVEQVEALAASGKKGRYRLRLGPDLVRLSRCSQHRVFSDKSLVEVIAEVLSGHDIGFDTAYSRTHVPEPVVVQYGESDLAFTSRLMREAGVFYYFLHSADGHEMMLHDSSDGISAMTGYETQSMLSAGDSGEGLVRLDPMVKARVSRIELDDVDPNRPDVDLAAGYGILRRGAPCATLHHYPGGYTEISRGLEQARSRLEGVQARSQTAAGEAASRGILVGRSFKLDGHPRKEQNADQVPIETVTVVEAGPATAAGPSRKTAKMYCNLVTTLLDASMPLPRGMPRRDLHGPHTAQVVSESGEEINVDEHARVRVRFPWQDRNEAGIWARVGQSWAGNGRGALVLPHVGDEVLVEFEHGDARRPVVVASLYNGTAPPPVELPDSKTQTLFRTRASESGAMSELRFHDRAGNELLSMQAGRDMEALIGNDSRIQIGGSVNRSVSGDEATSVGGNLAESVDGDCTSIISDDLLATIGGDLSQTVGKNHSLAIGKDLTVTIGGVGNVSSAKKLTITSDTHILIQNDNASIELKANGDVVIKGQKVLIEAAGQLRLKGSDVIEQEG